MKFILFKHIHISDNKNLNYNDNDVSETFNYKNICRMTLFKCLLNLLIHKLYCTYDN